MGLLTESADGLRDIRLGWQRREGWWAISRQSIRTSYRRTTLGPIWITIQQIAFIAGISLLYSQLFKVESTRLMPVVAFGISFWGLLSSYITGGSTVLIQQSQAIASSTLPISFYIFSKVSEQTLIFFHSAVVLVPFIFLIDISPRFICFATVPLSIVFAVVNGFSIGIWLGPLSTRYRDVSASVPIFVQLTLFLSPIFWSPTLLGDREWIINYNPVAWMIETFRSPILGGPVQVDLWIRLSVFTVTNLIIGVIVLNRVRSKISYWI